MTAALAWVLTHWKTILTGLVVAGLVFMLDIRTGQRDDAVALAKATQTAFNTTVANYRLAAQQAATAQAENVVRVKTEQAKITEDVEHAYQTKLADTATRYDQLRAKAAGYLSRPATDGLPDTREVTCQSVAASSCDELPGKLKAAQDNTDQLVSVLDWAERQGLVEFNAPASSPAPSPAP